MSEVVVVGGGAIGLLTALALVDRGKEVLVLEAPQHHPPASWAGGGILSALFPWRYPDALTQIAAGALPVYASLQARICRAGGPSIEAINCGMLLPSVADAPEALAWSRRWGVRMECTEARQIVGETIPEASALWMPDVGQVRNPRLLKGLRHLLARHGVVVRQAYVSSISHARGKWWVTSDSEAFPAKQVLVAAGAWSKDLLIPLGVSLPSYPVQGEMLLYPAPAQHRLRCIVLTDQGYLIPRKDGRIVVGSTVRPGVAAQRPSAAAYGSLKALAGRLWAPLKSAEPVAQWAGIRPGTNRAWPWLGEVPGHPGLFVATGHFRNGLVTAPASAELMASVMCGTAPGIDPAPYSLSSSSSSPP